jgi:hypothetical protein
MAYVYAILQLLRECGLAVHLFHIRTFIKKIPRSDRANEVDHIIIDIRQATTIPDVRPFRGAGDSDHYLVVPKRQRISNINNRNTFKADMWNTLKHPPQMISSNTKDKRTSKK